MRAMGWSARWVIAAIAFATAACSILTDLGSLTGGDAAVDAATDSPPSTDAAVRCDPLAPFTSVTPVGGASLASLNEYKAALSDDELEMWLGIELDGGVNAIESARRGSADASFGPTSPDPNLDAVGTNADPALSDDALTIVFSRQPGLVGDWDFFGATRANRTVGFDPPAPLVNVQSVAAEVAPFLGADGSLYFASNRAGSFDLFVAARAGNGFGTPAALNEMGIVVTRDGLWAYIESKRADMSIGGSDVFVAHRATTSAPFGPPAAVSELNTVFDERPNWISPDDCRLYFESNRIGGASAHDIFVASRSP
jgi:hypothetical protein